MTDLARLRAPNEDRAVLAEPPLASVGVRLDGNRRRLARDAVVLGRGLAELQRDARRATLTAAQDYLTAAGEPLPAGCHADSLLVAGHQPELFHPGVWVKNFALQGLARRHGVTPVNLVVDNDTAKTAALPVPRFHLPLPPIEKFQPNLVPVAFDRWSAQVAWEERSVQDEPLFRSFAERVPLDPAYPALLPAFWRDVAGQAGRTPLLGERFVAARRAWERRWGCHNLEVPVSAVCQTEPYARFAAHLLAELPRFHALYNETVRAYRRRHGIASRNHPVPDLAADGDWLEAPLWAWHASSPRRGRLFARHTAGAVELRAAAEAWPALPRGRPEATVAAYAQLAGAGYKIRSRALTNTLFARVFLCDLFVHGLGGGKYDELTDHLIRDFYGLEPPDYLVLSATLLLPVPRYPATAGDVRRLWDRVRALRCNPEEHLGGAGRHAEGLAARKRELIATRGATRRQRRERYHEIRRLTDELGGYVTGRYEAAHAEWERCRDMVEANAVLRRRDYAFCLYPEDVLRPFVTQFL